MDYIKCYDTFTKQYTTVQVEDEVAQFMRRSYWKEDMQNRRFQKRKVTIDDGVEYLISNEDLTDEVLKNIQIEVLKRALKVLDKRERLIVYYVYYMNLTLSDAAKRVGISSSYMSRVMRRIHATLRDEMDL